MTALGCAAHIAGDELTHGGCPLFWPGSMHEFHLLPRPLQITTAKLCETWVVFPLLLAGLAVGGLARDRPPARHPSAIEVAHCQGISHSPASVTYPRTRHLGANRQIA